MRNDGYNEGPPTNRAKIMVVDDDPDLRQALSLRLRANNFDTVIPPLPWRKKNTRT
jgi:hypothetical protein